MTIRPFLWAAVLLLPAAHAQFLQQGNKLQGNDAADRSLQGAGVALSADGNTAAVGGTFDHTGAGAVWIYIRANGVWTQQGPRLTANDGGAHPLLGAAVALSADGNTLLAGGLGDGSNNQPGGGWVFIRTNGAWTQQGPRLTGMGSFQGRTVSLSADGNTALVGGPGAVNIYTRANGTWTLNTTLPTGTGAAGEAAQGVSAALSGDGNTAIVGGNEDNFLTGAAWIYTRTGNTWSQQGPKLAGNDSFGQSFQGTSVALSGDGNTAVVGGEGDHGADGAAWVFTRAGGVWTQQGHKLTGAGVTGSAGQGHSVAISADGNTVVVGGPDDNLTVGAGWAFTRANGIWSRLGGKLIGIGFSGAPPAGGPREGTSIAVSGDGHTVLLGGPNDQPGGAAWAFVSGAIHFRVVAPNFAIAGVPFQFTVNAFNADNSPATAYNGTVHFFAGLPSAVLPADTTLNAGTGTFTATLKFAQGTTTLTVTDAANQTLTGSSDPILVEPGPTTHFVISGTPVSASPGQTVSFIIAAYDQFGNFAPNNTANVRFTSTDPAATLPPVSAMAGIRTLAAIFRTPGSQTLTAIDNTDASITGTSSVITVSQSSTIINLAAGKPAAQSSTYTGSSIAPLAVDGNTDGNFFNGSVTHTRQEAAPWWQVDLGTSGTVNSVIVYNRTDCCGARLSNYWVFVSDVPFGNNDTPATLRDRVNTFASHQDAAPAPYTTITVNGQGRYVRVQLDTNTLDYLSLAEVQVMGTPGTDTAVSIAQGKPARQSSTLPGYPSDSAGSAVDNNTNGNFFSGSVTHTNQEANPWWQVDLGANATINSVLVWNRTDCCATRLSDYWVFVSATPFNDGDTPAPLQNRPATFGIHMTAAPDPSTGIPIGGAVGFIGRYVRVQLNGPGYLSLAEVQVFGRPGEVHTAGN